MLIGQIELGTTKLHEHDNIIQPLELQLILSLYKYRLFISNFLAFCVVFSPTGTAFL
jgi:hypothetical protein